MRECRFVRCYVSEARGNGRYAASLAGYQGNVAVLDVQAARLLRRTRVREAIQHILEKETERQSLDKGWLVERVREVMAERRPFERVKAAELLAKLMGWFATARQASRILPRQEGAASYASLVETLRASGHQFTPLECAALRKELRGIVAEATNALELLGSHEDH